MEIYIQNCQTEKYLREDGAWTDKLSDAMRFSDSAEATVYCTKAKIDQAQILLKFERQELDVKILLKDCAPSKPFE